MEQKPIRQAQGESFWNTKMVLPMSIIIAAAMISASVIYVYRPNTLALSKTASVKKAKDVIPASVELPIVWKDLGAQLVATGVIDKNAFKAIFDQRGGLTPEDMKLLEGSDNGKLVITKSNASVVLDLLWAVGLGTKNPILEKGPLSDKRYGGVEKFASTGGFTFSQGEMMNHFSKHSFITLTAEQQSLVEKVAATIYRPCCDNPTLFPDCNHGMAMLGLLELMASQGVSEKDMYKAALAVNMMWFPGTYENIAEALAAKGLDFKAQDPAALLDATFSSASGYQQIVSEISPRSTQGGQGCSA